VGAPRPTVTRPGPAARTRSRPRPTRENAIRPNRGRIPLCRSTRVTRGKSGRTSGAAS
jgi:hypothetical protein